MSESWVYRMCQESQKSSAIRCQMILRWISAEPKKIKRSGMSDFWNAMKTPYLEGATLCATITEFENGLRVVDCPNATPSTNRSRKNTDQWASWLTGSRRWVRAQMEKYMYAAYLNEDNNIVRCDLSSPKAPRVRALVSRCYKVPAWPRLASQPLVYVTISQH